MPKYKFLCDKCENEKTIMISISKFMKLREAPNKCELCKHGMLTVSLQPTKGNIEKRKEDIVAQIEDEVREIVQKVHEGDEATIADIYGHESNKLK